MTASKKLVFTEGETELLKRLCNGCNIALYRSGEVRLRDSNHNPIKNIRKDMFEKIRQYCVQRGGLFYINDDLKHNFSTQILNG